MSLDTRHIGAGLAALGVIALGAAGYLKVQTPEAAQCAVDLAATKARMEGLVEVRDACKTALEACQGSRP